VKASLNTSVFLGGGRITGALAAGLRLAGNRRKIVVYDRHPEKLRALRRESQVEIAHDLQSAIEVADMLIIAVRPASVAEMLAEVRNCEVDPPQLCVSLAAGVPIGNLRSWLRRPWVRAMPSPVCRIGRGFTPVSFARDTGTNLRRQVHGLFSQVGPVLELPEGQLDAITAVASPTHGYHALANLAEAAENAGLDPDTALNAAAHALGDGIVYWRESQQGLEELLQEAATPGGIAAATMAAMDKSGYGRAVERGIQAGVAQAQKNAKLRK
jgi:pyrroline-5-carboxylate reductase